MKLEQAVALNSELVDVSLPVRAGMFPIAAASDVQLTELVGYDQGLYETQLRMSVHAGTHMDYASHIDPDGARAFPSDGLRDSIFPEHTFTLAYCLAFDDKQPTGVLREGVQCFGEEITAPELTTWFERFGRKYPGFPHHQVKGALLRTGWNDHWFDPDFWRRGGPTLSDEGARLLVARGLHYLASDFTFTFEEGRTHDIVMKNSSRFQVESLCNLGALKSEVVGLLVAPLKLQNCEGLPARVYATNIDLTPYEGSHGI